MEQKRFQFHTIKQWTAGVLLMLALGIFGGRADFDQPHLHMESSPTEINVISPISVYGNSASTTMTHFSWMPR